MGAIMTIDVSTNEAMVGKIAAEVQTQLQSLPRKAIAKQALANSKAVVLHSEADTVEMINEYAPEHLILAVTDPDGYAEKITNAGSVFLGNYTPESAGDYASGTNHTLPTNGFAKAFSGVSLESFTKSITFQKISEAGIQSLGPAIEAMAEAELLEAHKNAVSLRLAYLKNQ